MRRPTKTDIVRGEVDRLRVLELTRELRRYLARYRGEGMLAGVDEMIVRLSEAPPNPHDLRSLYRSLYQSKIQLADFHIEPGQAQDWVDVNRRLDALMRTIAARLRIQRFGTPVSVILKDRDHMFTVFDKDGRLYVTAVAGGVATYDVAITLTREDIDLFLRGENVW